VAEPLRIAVLVDQFPELSETFVLSEARELLRQGHAVRVEANQHAPNPVDASGIDAAYLADDSLIARLWSFVRLVLRFPLRCLRDVGLKRQLGREEPVRTLRELAPCALRLRSFGAAHLHAHFARGAAADALRLGALLGVPYSVMTHGYDIFQLPQSLRLKHERAAFAVSACDYSVRYLESEFGAHASRLITGVHGEAFARRTPYDPSATVVAVGRLVEKKGFGVLVEAAASVPGLSRVTIVGDGPLRSELEARVRELGLSSVVSIVGPQPPGRVRELLEDAALLAAPCVVAADGDRDTMPVVVKEALAMEVPVVASDEVGLPEVVRPEWGRLVPPGDAAALAAAISELLALPVERRREMGRAGRAFVLEECNLTRETERLAGLISGVVDLSPE
jgi:colanic acid/amylovoran biosynthesis glycosyltransferase